MDEWWQVIALLAHAARLLKQIVAFSQRVTLNVLLNDFAKQLIC